MKKSLLFVSALTIFVSLVFSGCSLINQTKLTPPEWIQGSWSDDYDIFNWEFTSDNILYTSSISMDYKALATDPEVEIVTEETDSTYEMTYTSYGTSTNYFWTSVDDTTITYSIGGGSAVILHKD